MTSRIRIPGLLDVTRIDEPPLIAAVSQDARLDRDFAGTGPRLNQWIARRIIRTLKVGDTPLPSVSPRNAPDRAERQAELEAELNGALGAGEPAAEQLDRLAAYLRGRSKEKTLGPVAQEAIGQQFNADYRGTRKTWRAARILDAAPRNVNPLRALWWALTGAVQRSRRVLAEAVKNDRAGVHATAIAVHSLVRSLRAMRELWREPGVRRSLSAENAALRSLRAPETVLRRWSVPADTTLGEMPRGALVMFQLDAARTRDPGPDIVFMSESWSRCPASRWTPALLEAVWRRAASQEP